MAEVKPGRSILSVQVKAVGHQVGGVLNRTNLIEGMGESIVRCIRKAVRSALIQRHQQRVIVGLSCARAEENALRQVVIERRQTGKQALLVNRAEDAADVSVRGVEGDLGNDWVGLSRNHGHGHGTVLANSKDTQCGIDAARSASRSARASAVACGTGKVESLRKPNTKGWDDHTLDGVLAVIIVTKTLPHASPTSSEHPTFQLAIPCRRP